MQAHNRWANSTHLKSDIKEIRTVRADFKISYTISKIDRPLPWPDPSVKCTRVWLCLEKGLVQPGYLTIDFCAVESPDLQGAVIETCLYS